MEVFYRKAQRKMHDLELLGVFLHRVNENDLNAYIGNVIKVREQALITNVNIHCMILTQKNDELKQFLNQSNVVYCDGDGVRWGCQLLKKEPPPKVAFTRWIWSLAAYAEKEGLSLYLLGANPGVAEIARERLVQKYPMLKIVGVHDGYFKKEGVENTQVIEGINAVQPDILVVGFGMPYQEEWLKKNWQKIKAHIFLPGGGVIDYAAGKLGEVPQWMIRSHLEWLFRIFEEPRRLFWRYAIEIPVFFYYIFKEKLFGAYAKNNDRNRCEK